MRAWKYRHLALLALFIQIISIGCRNVENVTPRSSAEGVAQPEDIPEVADTAVASNPVQPVPTAPPDPIEVPAPAAPTTYRTSPKNLSAAWANDGGDKVAREEVRASSNTSSVVSRVWNGQSIQLFGAKNEVVAFNLVLEAKLRAASGVSVALKELRGPDGFVISSKSPSNVADGLFDWRERHVELFFIRYLPIRGLSKLSYETYDERHVPKRMRRLWTGAGVASGQWGDRPDHDRYYPEVAVPLEAVQSFGILANSNQSIWGDIYIPRTAPAGRYSGTLTVTESGEISYEIPVVLEVKNFSLPDSPSSKTMVYLGYGDIAERYTGVRWPNPGTAEDTRLKSVRDRHFLLAHRHKISLIDNNEGSANWSSDAPRPEWLPRLNGSLFTSTNGYDGPGLGVGNDVYSIGTYGQWSWKSEGETGMRRHTDAWESWFRSNSPSTERFIYLIDESTDYAQIEQWSTWINRNPGAGSGLMSFATLAATHARQNAPSLDIAATWFTVGDTAAWNSTAAAIEADGGKRLYMYNGKRPANGSFATEDDGVALRQLAWGQHKMGVDRWFFWESTYYNDFQSGRGRNDLFNDAQTFGSFTGTDPTSGRTGWNYSNGDGVLFYPGTDRSFPNDSHGITGPIASLRLKHWRRGIQDMDYVSLAAAIDPARVREIVNRMVPKALWEYGIADPNDPTWVRTDISWSTNPDDWESARAELAAIIENGS